MTFADFPPAEAGTAFTDAVKISRMGRPAKRLHRYPNRLKEWRDRLDLTQEQAAARVGINHQNWQRYETGERELKITKLEQIARGLGIPAAQLLSSTDPATDERERALLSIFRRLAHDDRERLHKMAAALLPAPAAAGRKAVS